MRGTQTLAAAPIETCANCKHARPHTDRGPIVDVARGQALQCWRFPPVSVGGPTPQGMALLTAAPVVSSADSCGEFSPKPTAAN